MRLFIIGFKSSGKTTFGHRLAARLNLEFIDMDECIEKKYRITVPELYTREGEEAFRLKERIVLREIVKKDGIVVSAGGGAACHCDNMTLMEKYGDVIYIKVDTDTLVNRLIKVAPSRPVIKGRTKEEVRQYIHDLKEKCEHHYLRAKYVLYGETLSVENLIDLLETG